MEKGYQGHANSLLVPRDIILIIELFKMNIIFTEVLCSLKVFVNIFYSIRKAEGNHSHRALDNI